ncbi:hypothetical protein ACFLWC_00845 [Chloroflexota bacterium]
MKTGFMVSLIIFIITLIFLVAVNSIDFGIGIVYPEGVSESTPNIMQMREIINALQKYNQVDGIISILSFVSTGIIGLIAKIRGISFTN